MAGIAAKAKELVASNLTSLIEKATDPAKMLRLLRAEIEESVIALQDTLTKANRRYGRLEGELTGLERAAKDWTGKARLAMDKGREDLAREALLAREAVRIDVDEAKAALKALAGEAADAEQAITRLEAKLSEIRQQIAQYAEPARTGTRATGTVSAQLDRIDELERRVANGSANQARLSEAELDRQLRALERDERIEAELASLKTAAGKASAKKKR